MVKNIKVEKELFDHVLGRILNTPTVPRKKLKGNKKLRQILELIKPTRQPLLSDMAVSFL